MIWGAKAKGQLTAAELSLIPKNIIEQIVVIGDNEYGKFYNRIRPLKLIKNEKGRFVFDPKDNLSKELRGSSIIGIIETETKGYSDSELKQVACQVNGTLLADVKSAKGNNFKLKVLDSQMIDEEAKCIDAKGKKVMDFWLPVSKLKPSH